MSGSKKLLFLPNNDLFRLERKIAHEVLGPSQKKVFAPQQDLESKALLYEYLVQPENWWLAHARYSSSVIMNVLFGRRTKLGDNNITNILNMAEKVFEVILPGSNIVDAFPWLARVPLPKWMQPWRWTGDKYYQQTLAYVYPCPLHYQTVLGRRLTISRCQKLRKGIRGFARAWEERASNSLRYIRNHKVEQA